MKRTKETYQSFEIYEEMNYIDFLTPLQKLVFASLYNLVSKGKGKLQMGLMVNSFSKILEQHYIQFGLNKKPTRKEWQLAIEELIKFDMINQVAPFKTQIEKMGRMIPVERPNYHISEFGRASIARAKDILKHKNLNLKSLF